MDLNQAIKTAYFKALKGNILQDGEVVPVVDSFAIPTNLTYPYIVLNTISTKQISVKRCFIYDAFAQVDIVTGSINNIGTEKSNEISENVQKILIPLDFTDLDLNSYGFEIAKSELSSNLNISDKSDNIYLFRKILTIQHLINKI